MGVVRSPRFCLMVSTPRWATARRVAELFDAVTVSVDGGTAEVHERTRGKGTFAQTAKGLALLNEAGVVPMINHVVTPGNIDYLDRLADFVGGLKFRQVRLMSHSKLGRGAGDGGGHSVSARG